MSKLTSRDIIEKLEARGLSRKASGAKEFWRAYRLEYQRLPEVREALSTKRREKREKIREARYEAGEVVLASRAQGYNRLTLEQLCVALEILKGKSNAEVAEAVNKTVKAVKFHAGFVFAKAKVKTRYEFIAKWREQMLPVKIQRQLPEPPGVRKESPADVLTLPVGLKK